MAAICVGIFVSYQGNQVIQAAGRHSFEFYCRRHGGRSVMLTRGISLDILLPEGIKSVWWEYSCDGEYSEDFNKGKC